MLIAAGKRCYRIRLLGRDHKKALQLKLYEEWQEFWEKPSAEEIGDCLQVLMDTAAAHGIDWERVEAAQAQKSYEKGSFSDGWEIEIP